MSTEVLLGVALAQWLGAHAFGVFALGLCLVLVAAGGAWHLVGRRIHPGPAGAQPSPWRLALLFFAGFVVIVGASAGFAEIAEEIGPGGRVARFDEAFAAALVAELAPATGRVFAAVTRLGDTRTLVGLGALVATVLVLLGRPRLAFGWVLALAGNGLLNETLKAVFERVRPVHEADLVAARGWSFPSGHASGAVVAYGLLAYLLIWALPARWHLPIVLAAAALAFTIGSSRVFVHVHYASDVLAGFLSGSAWLAVCIVAFELARHYRSR
ncbi:MAG TPA: phosphatase PAP2 family protein [Zeimonas sp.]|nr:phosphatase PAP2 family protein [Zeimonas sp.]